MLRSSKQKVRSLVHPLTESLVHNHRMRQWPFYAGVILPELTFFRASGATSFANNNNIITHSNNQPRIGHLQDGSSIRGLLVEEARTNIILQSEEFDNASWFKVNSIITANVAVAPDGTTTADKLGRTDISNNYIQQVVNKPASSIIYTSSVYVHKTLGDDFIAMRVQGKFPARADICYNKFTDTITLQTTTSGFTNLSVNTQESGDYVRLIATVTSDTHTFVSQLLAARSTSGGIDANDPSSTANIVIWGAQLEEGGVATSYIPTVTFPKTRAPDVATINLMGTSWFNPNEGTIVVEAIVPTPPAATAHLFSIDTGLANNSIIMRHGFTNPAEVFPIITTSGISQANFTAGVAVNGVLYKAGLSYKGNDCAFVFNGAGVSAGNTVILPSGLTTLRIGSSANGNEFCGLIKNLSYYPVYLPGPTLQGLTS